MILKKIHRIFNGCDNLNEVKKHINNLFKHKCVWLSKTQDESITLNLKIGNIAVFEDIPVDLNRKMTTEKDKVLIELYNIQKKEIKYLKIWKNI